MDVLEHTGAAAPAPLVDITLTADEANAIVYAVANELTLSAAEDLDGLEVSTTPGDLIRIAEPARRITQLAAINDQLEWRAHWGRHGGEPPALTVTEPVLLDLAAVLQKWASDQRKADEEDRPELMEFDRAARAVARAFADTQAVLA